MAEKAGEEGAEAAGEAVAGNAELPGPPQKSFKGTLPPIPRTIALPTLADLPEKRAAKYQDKTRDPRVRLFIFYGVADNFVEWLPFITEAPEWVEVAVYECKAHGVRDSEPWDQSMEERLEDAWLALLPAMEEHARGGCVEGAPFAFFVHSSGAQLMTLVCQRLRQRLSLDPAAVFIADRSPPNIRAISDYGHRLLRQEPVKFFEHFNPRAAKLHGKGNPVSDAMYERWRCGMLLTQEHVCEEKYHVFDCPIYVFIACAIFELDKLYNKGAKSGVSPEALEQHKKRCLVVQSAKDSEADWDLRQYGMWRRWAASGKADVQRVMCDHSECRFHPEVQEKLWKELAAIRDGRR